MKYIIEGQYKGSIEIKNMYYKFNIIEDNIEFIIGQLYDQYPMDKLCRDTFKNDPLMLTSSIVSIVLDTDLALDEFYLKLQDVDDSIIIEVVTKEVAESNDKEYVNLDNGYTQEELDSYVLGGTLSVYTEIPNTNMYFKFM